jgi:hypothetical protein
VKYSKPVFYPFRFTLSIEDGYGINQSGLIGLIG